MCTYLDKVGSTYYFRRIVPEELRPYLLTSSGKPRAEFKLSLGTKDREDAKALLPDFVQRTNILFDEARAKLAESAPSESVPATPFDGGWLGDFGQEQAEFAARKEVERQRRRAERRHHRDEWRERLNGSTEQMPPRYAALRDILREREDRAAAEARLKAIQTPDEPTAQLAVSSSPGRSSPGLWLDKEVVDGWAAERQPDQKGIDTHRSTARWFYDRVGRKPVRELTEEDFLAFKTKLIAEGKTPANIKQKLSHLRTLMGWAKANRHVDANVAAHVTIRDGQAAKKKRLPFDLPALTAIFSSPVYAEGARPTSLRGEAAYWLPLLGLFTGARLEELGQLRPQDVNEVRYIDNEGDEKTAWIIQVREDKDAQLKLKNAASERRIPIHAELVGLGFLDFVMGAKTAKQQRLFPMLKPNIYGRLTAKWGEHWSKYKREVCYVTDPRMVFHSFRHTFKDYCRLAGIEETLQRALMGHSSGNVADDYGSGAWDHQLVEAMRRYRVPGLRIGKQVEITKAP